MAESQAFDDAVRFEYTPGIDEIRAQALHCYDHHVSRRGRFVRDYGWATGLAALLTLATLASGPKLVPVAFGVFAVICLVILSKWYGRARLNWLRTTPEFVPTPNQVRIDSQGITFEMEGQSLFHSWAPGQTVTITATHLFVCTEEVVTALPLRYLSEETVTRIRRWLDAALPDPAGEGTEAPAAGAELELSLFEMARWFGVRPRVRRATVLFWVGIWAAFAGVLAISMFFLAQNLDVARFAAVVAVMFTVSVAIGLAIPWGEALLSFLWSLAKLWRLDRTLTVNADTDGLLIFGGHIHVLVRWTNVQAEVKGDTTQLRFLGRALEVPKAKFADSSAFEAFAARLEKHARPISA